MKTKFYKLPKGLMVSTFSLKEDLVVLKNESNVFLSLICNIDLKSIDSEIAYLIKISSSIYPVWSHDYNAHRSGFSLQTLKNLHSLSKSALSFDSWIVEEGLEIDLYLVNNFQDYIKYSTKINFID